MTDIDLDRLGDVWRQQPDPAEMAQLQRIAAMVGRRARLANVVDVGATIAVCSVVIALVIANPGIRTVAAGTAAILILLLGQIRQRRLRQVELRSLTGTTEEMLDQSIDRIETTIRHNRFTLIASGPGLLLGWIFMNAVTDEPVRNLLPESFDAPTFRLLWNGGWLAALAGLVLFLTFAIRRGRRELERLSSMRDSYRQEHESTGS